MSALTQKQRRFAIFLALLLYAAAMGGGIAWLHSNSETTLQYRAALVPNTTVNLPGKEPEVPTSWQEQKPEAAPEQTAVAEEPPVQQTVAPSADLQTAGKMPVEETPVATEPAVSVDPTATPSEPAAMQKWQKFARPFDQKDTRPRIGLVIGDLGLATTATQAAVQDLPGEVTLAFSSLAPELESWLAKSRVAGHETVLTIPMEPENYPQNDPGPNTLLTTLPDQDNVSRIRWALARADNYVAIMPSMGQKFVTSEAKLSPILDVVKDQELIIFDGTLNRESLIAPLSRLGKIPFTRADTVIDAAASRSAIETQLDMLEKTALEKGQAIGIALPYPVTFEKLREWIPTLEKKGIILAPLTALASEDLPQSMPQSVPTESLPETPKSE